MGGAVILRGGTGGDPEGRCGKPRWGKVASYTKPAGLHRGECCGAGQAEPRAGRLGEG